MLCSHFSEKLIGIQEVEAKNIEENAGKITIEIELFRKECKCPVCGKHTSKIHDYRYQKVKDIPAFGKKVVFILRVNNGARAPLARSFSTTSTEK